MPKKKGYLIRRGEIESNVLVCGSLNFDVSINRIWSNKPNRPTFVKRNSHYRKLLMALMGSSGKLFTYDELIEILYVGSDKKQPTGDGIRKKFVNDKIDALKKKLFAVGFTRDELKIMFICDDGYRLVEPKAGRKQTKST